MCALDGHMGKLTRVSAAVTIFAACALVLVLTYWQFWPYDILTQHDGSKIITPVVRAGDYVVFEVHTCKNYDVPETDYRQLVDGFVYQLPAVQRYREMGCNTTHMGVPIPWATPPGKYHLQTTAEFKPNPIRFVRYYFTTEDFTVVARTKNVKELTAKE